MKKLPIQTDYIVGIVCWIILLLLSSCESQRAANKTAWLKERGYLQSDTMRFSDTIRGFTHDTIIQFDSVTLTDTLTIEKNGIKTLTIVKWKDRIVEQTITQHDTIRHYIKPIIKEGCPECKTSWWHNFLQHWAIGMISCIVFVFALKKFT